MIPDHSKPLAVVVSKPRASGDDPYLTRFGRKGDA